MRLKNESARRGQRQADDSLDSLAGGSASDTGHLHLTPTPNEAQDAARDFLARFAQLRRSLITNQFCFAVRGGCHSVGNVLRWVREDAYRRLRQRYTDLEVREAQHTLIASLDTPEAATFARFILEREQLPSDERQRVKTGRSEHYAREWMATQPPTRKQCEYLAALGCHVTPVNKLEASQLIEQFRQQRHRLAPPVAVTQGDLFERKEVA